MKIRIFTTGGTFDKEYDEINGKLFFKDTHLPKMLEMGRSRLEVECTSLMMMDSLDMIQEDREKIAQACLEASEERIVITHGTDTMVETAKVLSEKIHGKTIVLTGAMIPITFGSSDGLFNIGAALAFVQTLPPGVYISMHGFYFDWDNVRKNKEIGKFETVK